MMYLALLRSTGRPALVALVLSLLALLVTTGAASGSAPRSLTLPPLPTRAVVVCSDVSASVPLSLAAATKQFVVRSLEHAYAALDQGVPDTLVEWTQIGVDSFSPASVLVRGWIRGVHSEPRSPFVSLRVRRAIDAVIASERRSMERALHTVLGAIARVPLQVQWGTDLLGCVQRFEQDTAFITGPRTLILSTDLIGAPPENNWNLSNTVIFAFQYCSRDHDSPSACAARRGAWDAALRHAGATIHWLSSDDLDVLPFVAF